MIKFFLIVAFTLLFTAHCHEGQDHEESEETSDVVVLNDENFEETIKNNEFVFVEFYAPWCGHCKRLAPEYEIVASHFKDDSKIVIAKIDATQNPGVGAKQNIRGYPTLKFFRYGNPLDYEEERKASDMIQWLKKKSGPPSTHITTREALDAFLSGMGTKIVAYVKDDSVWNDIAKSGQLDDFILGHVTDNSLFEDKSENTLVFHKPDEESVVYSGAFDQKDITNFALEEGYPLVDELAQKIWQRSQVQGKPLLAIFLQNQEDMALAKTVGQKYKGKILTSYSNVHQLAEKWGASGKKFPTAILVRWINEEPKMFIYDEDGEPLTVETCESFITQSLEGSYKSYRKSEPIPESNDGPVKIVVGKTFEEIVFDSEKDVFVEFYAPWCGHCKKLAPVWDELGEAFEDVETVVIAKIDATSNTTPDTIDIRGFPTLIYFPADNKGGIPFDGDRDLESLRKFVVEHASHTISKGEKEEL